MPNLFHDLRTATRSLLRTPAVTATAIGTLALGIGGGAAIYTVFKRVVVDPLPYPAADRLVRLKNQVPGVAPDEEWQMSAAQYFFLQDRAPFIEEVAAFNVGELPVETPSGPEPAVTALASHETMGIIGARPLIGRTITASDDRPGAPPVAVLSYGFWKSRFGGREEIVGQSVTAFGLTMEVVGVLEPGSDLPPEPGAVPSGPVEMWIPLAAVDDRFNPEGPFYGNHTTPMIARLAPGIEIEQAQAAMDQLTRLLPEIYPDAYSAEDFERYGLRPVLYPLKPYVLGSAAASLRIIAGMGALVLLVACTNVANLLLVRTEARKRELAVRQALGASRVAIARQLFAEALVLAVAAGGLALLAATWIVAGIVALAPDVIPRLGGISIDQEIVLTTVAGILVVAFALAALPIIRTSRAGPRDELAEGGRGKTSGPARQRVRAALVALQIAMALMLTIGAVLLVESFRRVRAIDPGIDGRGTIAVRLQLNPANYGGNGDIPAMWRFYDQVLEQVRAIPGVTAAGMTMGLPLTGVFGCTVQGFEDVEVYDRVAGSESTTCASQMPTTPGYFEAIGIPLLRGRSFVHADNDQPNTGAVIVSQAFAERFWPGEDPIGKGVAPSGRRQGPFYRVVGVVGDVYSNSPVEDPYPVIYYPIVRIPESGGWTPSQIALVVRSSLDDPLTVYPALREVIHRVDPSTPVDEAIVIRSLVDRSTAILSFSMTLIGLAALLAIALAAVGLYAVMAYVVSGRTAEIGIRIAVGARETAIHKLVLGGSAKMVLVGLLGGAIAAGLGTRLMGSILYGVQSIDASAYLVASGLLALVALAATYLPARSAAQVDPMTVLRRE